MTKELLKVSARVSFESRVPLQRLEEAHALLHAGEEHPYPAETVQNLGAGRIESGVLPGSAIFRGGHEPNKGRRGVPRGAVGRGCGTIERVQVDAGR